MVVRGTVTVPPGPSGAVAPTAPSTRMATLPVGWPSPAHCGPTCAWKVTRSPYAEDVVLPEIVAALVVRSTVCDRGIPALELPENPGAPSNSAQILWVPMVRSYVVNEAVPFCIVTQMGFARLVSSM